MKKAICIVVALMLALTVAFGLCACGETETPSGGNETPGTEQPSTPGETETPADPAKQNFTGLTLGDLTVTYDGEEHVSIASLGEDIFKQTIVINGVSKSYAMTGWRIGYTAGPTEVIKAMSSLQSQVASGSNSIAQYAAEEALRSPKGREAIERMHRAYDERRRHIVQRLNAIDGLTCVMPKGAFYVMVDMSALIGKHLGDRKIAGSMDFADMLLENANVALTPGTAFCAEGYCRISYATSMEQIDKGVDRIEHFVNNLV